MLDRITSSLTDIGEILDEIEYKLSLISETAEIANGSKLVRGRMQSAITATKRASGFLCDLRDAYRETRKEKTNE